MISGVFTQDQEELTEISYSLLLRRKSEVELYREKQKLLLQDIFK